MGGAVEAITTRNASQRRLIRSNRKFADLKSWQTARQLLDLQAQPFLCDIDLRVFEWIFIAARHQERELTASLEETAEVDITPATILNR